jgi:hypothetical protein
VRNQCDSSELPKFVTADCAAYGWKCVGQTHRLMNVTGSDRDLGTALCSSGTNIVIDGKLPNAICLAGRSVWVHIASRRHQVGVQLEPLFTGFRLDIQLFGGLRKVPEQSGAEPAFQVQLGRVVPVAATVFAPPVQTILVSWKGCG